jgi:hypothetical protein
VLWIMTVLPEPETPLNRSQKARPTAALAASQVVLIRRSGPTYTIGSTATLFPTTPIQSIYDTGVVARQSHTHAARTEQAVTGRVFEAGGLLRASSAAGLEMFLGRQQGIGAVAANPVSQTVTVQLEGIRRYGA